MLGNEDGYILVEATTEVVIGIRLRARSFILPRIIFQTVKVSLNHPFVLKEKPVFSQPIDEFAQSLIPQLFIFNNFLAGHRPGAVAAVVAEDVEGD
jgi:hypothetical protein